MNTFQYLIYFLLVGKAYFLNWLKRRKIDQEHPIKIFQFNWIWVLRWGSITPNLSYYDIWNTRVSPANCGCPEPFCQMPESIGI